MWNDTELQHDIENEIGWELSAGLTLISVTVKSGAVELGGHVDSFWEKCAAERAAWRVAHVNHVTSGIRVVVPFNKQRADDDIALAAMSSLEWNCLVPETVEVQVAPGVGDPFRQRRTATAEGRGRARAVYPERDHGHPQ